MTIDTDLSTPLDQVRFLIGDPDGTFISDATINALLTINSDNVNKTAIECIQAIVADLAKQVRQEIDEVQVWANQYYDHYRQLLIDLTTNPAFMLTPALHILGGVSKSEARRVKCNPDSRSIRISEGFGTETSEFIYNKDNSFFLDES